MDHNIKSYGCPEDAHLRTTVDLFEKICPNPVSKNFHTQLGVHFEEISEMTASLKGMNRMTQALLTQALIATHALALHLKASDGVVMVEDRIEFLDGLGDQIVTAAGTAHMAGMDIVGALGEINRSNFSKLDENGQPILDENKKFIKGPNYFKPNLKPFV